MRAGRNRNVRMVSETSVQKMFCKSDGCTRKFSVTDPHRYCKRHRDCYDFSACKILPEDCGSCQEIKNDPSNSVEPFVSSPIGLYIESLQDSRRKRHIKDFFVSKESYENFMERDSKFREDDDDIMLVDRHSDEERRENRDNRSVNGHENGRSRRGEGRTRRGEGRSRRDYDKPSRNEDRSRRDDERDSNYNDGRNIGKRRTEELRERGKELMKVWKGRRDEEFNRNGSPQRRHRQSSRDYPDDRGQDFQHHNRDGQDFPSQNYHHGLSPASGPGPGPGDQYHHGFSSAPGPIPGPNDQHHHGYSPTPGPGPSDQYFAPISNQNYPQQAPVADQYYPNHAPASNQFSGPNQHYPEHNNGPNNVYQPPNQMYPQHNPGPGNQFNCPPPQPGNPYGTPYQMHAQPADVSANPYLAPGQNYQKPELTVESMKQILGSVGTGSFPQQSVPQSSEVYGANNTAYNMSAPTNATNPYVSQQFDMHSNTHASAYNGQQPVMPASSHAVHSEPSHPKPHATKSINERLGGYAPAPEAYFVQNDAKPKAPVQNEDSKFKSDYSPMCTLNILCEAKSLLGFLADPILGLQKEAANLESENKDSMVLFEDADPVQLVKLCLGKLEKLNPEDVKDSDDQFMINPAKNLCVTLMNEIMKRN